MQFQVFKINSCKDCLVSYCPCWIAFDSQERGGKLQFFVFTKLDSFARVGQCQDKANVTLKVIRVKIWWKYSISYMVFTYTWYILFFPVLRSCGVQLLPSSQTYGCGWNSWYRINGWLIRSANRYKKGSSFISDKNF